MSELTPDQRTEILERHLHDHGHVDPDDIDAAIAAAESTTGDGPSPALGARVVARAWVDAEFRESLLADPVNTIAEYHPQTVPIAVLEDTPSVHHVIVCTLCSCYPSGLLGNPPAWYKSFEYRSRVCANRGRCSPNSAWTSTPTSSYASTTQPPSSAT